MLKKLMAFLLLKFGSPNVIAMSRFSTTSLLFFFFFGGGGGGGILLYNF